MASSDRASAVSHRSAWSSASRQRSVPPHFARRPGARRRRAGEGAHGWLRPTRQRPGPVGTPRRGGSALRRRPRPRERPRGPPPETGARHTQSARRARRIGGRRRCCHRKRCGAAGAPAEERLGRPHRRHRSRGAWRAYHGNGGRARVSGTPAVPAPWCRAAPGACVGVLAVGLPSSLKTSPVTRSRLGKGRLRYRACAERQPPFTVDSRSRAMFRCDPGQPTGGTMAKDILHIRLELTPGAAGCRRACHRPRRGSARADRHRAE